MGPQTLAPASLDPQAERIPSPAGKVASRKTRPEGVRDGGLIRTDPPRSREWHAADHASSRGGFADGPQAGLELLEPLLADPALERYQPLHAADADLLRRAGDAAGAERVRASNRAQRQREVERAELQRRLSALDAD
jgi:hypothetical protein